MRDFYNSQKTIVILFYCEKILYLLITDFNPSYHMKKTFILLTLICMVHTAFACEFCIIRNRLHDYGQMMDEEDFRTYRYKGNVQKVQMVETYTGQDELGRMKIDTTISVTLSYDKDKKRMLVDAACDEFKRYEKYENINGKRVLVARGDESSLQEYIYSWNGKLRASKYHKASECTKTYYNINEKDSLSIIYKKRRSSRMRNGRHMHWDDMLLEITGYELFFYDKNGNDTAIVSYDKDYNVTHRIRKIYDPQGHLTEMYDDGVLKEYHQYDSTGRLVADSSQGGQENYEYEEIDEETEFAHMKGDLADTTITCTTYDSDGKALSQTIHVRFWEKTKARYTYNRRGQLLSIQTKDCQIAVNKVVDRTEWGWTRRLEADKITYIYDKKRRLVSEVYSCGKNIVRQFTYYYDADGHLVEGMIETNYPTDASESDEEGKGKYPEAKIVTIRYDEKGNMIEGRKKFKKNGKIEEVKGGLFFRYTYYDE